MHETIVEPLKICRVKRLHFYSYLGSSGVPSFVTDCACAETIARSAITIAQDRTSSTSTIVHVAERTETIYRATSEAVVGAFSQSIE